METNHSKTRPTSPDGEVALRLQIFGASPFAVLAAQSRDALLELGRVERLPRRHRLTEQGEAPRCLFLLGSGRVKLERITAERVFPLGHRGPGQMVGETAIAGALGAGDPPAAAEHAVVVDELEALALPMSGVKRLLLSDLAFRAAMGAALLEQQREAERRLAALLLHGVEARLMRFLLDAAARWGKPHTRGELIGAPFTHADIALLIGSTRETVTLLLGKLKRSAAIDFDRRRVLLCDRAALERQLAAL
ncbi:MAG: Crp/Fnr family transcriptional regulator [Minicystis sp.]